MFDRSGLQSHLDDLCHSIHRRPPRLIYISTHAPVAAVLLIPRRGFLFLSQGLIDRLDGDWDEIDAVLLHEMAHVFHGDGIFRLFALWAFGLFLAWGCVLVAALSSSWTIFLGIVLVVGAMALIGREQEYRADFTAASWMKNPGALIRALQKVEPRRPFRPIRDSFSSHPHVEQRIQRLHDAFFDT